MSHQRKDNYRIMDTANANIIREQLKYYRESRNYSQQTVADYLQISRSAYTNYEIGCRVPDIFTLDRLARLYSVAIESFLYPKRLYNTLTYLQENAYVQNKVPATELDAEETALIYNYRKLSPRDKMELPHIADYKAHH